MSVAQATTAAAVGEDVQAGLPKNMVPDPGWFDGDWSKFEDWWRGIRLFLKSNRVNGMDDSVKIADDGINFYFHFLFYFYFYFIFYF